MTIVISGYNILIDDEDFERVTARSWHKHGNHQNEYFQASPCRKKGFYTCDRLHRFILGVTDRKIFVDHKNGNNLDNRKENLRTCTPLENSRNAKKPRHNTSGYKGVHYRAKAKKWIAQIRIMRKTKYLGSFPDPESAYEAYCEASKEIFGEFSRLD